MSGFCKCNCIEHCHFLIKYGEADYWDRRYQAEPVFFDWYLLYEQLAPVLTKYVRPEDHVLQLGVGTSLLQAHMVQQGGYQQILSVDISIVAIQHMREVHSNIPQLKYRVGDARSLPQYKDGCFDAIIDKGTLDSLMCSQQAYADSTQMLEECHRLLRPGGVLLLVTYGEPALRVPLLSRLPGQVCLYLLCKATEVAAAAAVGGSPAPGAGQGGTSVLGPLQVTAEMHLPACSEAQAVYYVYVYTKQCSSAATPTAAAAAAAVAAADTAPTAAAEAARTASAISASASCSTSVEA